MAHASVSTDEPSLRALTTDELQLASGGNALAVGVFAGVVIGVTLYLGYEAYKAADKLVKDSNQQSGNSEGR